MEPHLFLSGRSSEIINVGGSKIDLGLIDEYVIGRFGIEDAAAFGLIDSDGIIRVAIAVVESDAFDREEFNSELQFRFGNMAPKRIYTIRVIPRNLNGKALRIELTQKYSEIANH